MTYQDYKVNFKVDACLIKKWCIVLKLLDENNIYIISLKILIENIVKS